MKKCRKNKRQSTPKNQFKFEGYIKVGRIKQTVAKEAYIKAADIMVNANHVKHIAAKHSTELNLCGITPLEYIKVIVENFNEIRKNKDLSLLLVKTNEGSDADTVTIELLYHVESEFWEIKTAQPRRDLKNNELLWKSKKKSKAI